MAKKNSYSSWDGYDVSGLPHGFAGDNVSTKFDDTLILIVQTIQVQDLDRLVEEVVNFRDNVDDARGQITGSWGRPRGLLTLSGWRETTADERHRIAKMKQKRAEKKRIERERQRERQHRAKRQEEERRRHVEEQQAEYAATKEDALLGEALKILKNRGAKITIEK